MDIIYMTYCPDAANESATGRRTEIEITPEMIEAAEKDLVFSSELIRADVVFDILATALEAGGYKVADVTELA
jgi:hypothetical protein